MRFVVVEEAFGVLHPDYVFCALLWGVSFGEVREDYVGVWELFAEVFGGYAELEDIWREAEVRKAINVPFDIVKLLNHLEKREIGCEIRRNYLFLLDDLRHFNKLSIADHAC